MLKLAVIGFGGFIGAIGRYLLSGIVQKQLGSGFPYGTLAVNVVGCFLLGVVMHLVQNEGMFTPNVRLFITIGILGAFTTYSTFGYETLALISAREIWPGLLNILGNVVLGLLAVWLGAVSVRLAGY